MKLLWLCCVTLSLYGMEEARKAEVVESNLRSHHTSTHSVHNLQAEITETSPVASRRPRSYTVNMHTEEKESHESDQVETKYSSKFMILSNAGSALVGAGISAGVTIAIALHQCGK